MSDRVVTYTLRGNITDLAAKFTAASASTKKLAGDLTDLDAKGARMRSGLTAIGTSAGKMGLVAAAGLGAIALATVRFDKQMSAVQAATHASAGAMEDLRAAAIKAGADTVFSASEAANGIEELAKAGISTKDILGGGLKGSLDLAAAGALGVGEAAETAATALTQFKLQGSDVPHVADLLAAAAGKAQGSVSDMGMALKQSGLVASQTGLTIEETTGTLAAFASAGLIGSDAGTSFKTMLQSLTPTGAQAQATMDKLGITAYDAQGNFIGMAKFADNLRNGLAGLSVEQQNAAMKTIFGSDAVRAASVVFQQGGAGIQSWIDKVNDSGYAAETAKMRMDNLAGDLEQLKGSIETALIGTGEGANGPLRETVQILTKLVNAYSALPGPIKNGAVAVLALTAAIGGTAFVVSRAVSGYSNLKGNVADLGVSFEKANKRALAFRGAAAAAGVGMIALSGPAHKANKELGLLTDVGGAAAIGFAAGGPWGAAIGGGAALLGSLGGSSADAAATMQDLTATLDQQTGAVTENTAKWAAKQLIDSGAADTLKKMGISLKEATDAATGNSDALIEQAAASGDLGRNQAFALAQIHAMSEGVQKGAEDTEALATVTDQSAVATGTAADQFGGMATAADAAADDIQSLQDALNGLLDPLLDQDSAMVAWKESLSTLTGELKANGGTLDSNTAKGRKNRDAIRDRVSALKDSVNADAAAGVGQDQLSQKLIRGAEKILAAGTAAGISKTKMKEYLHQLGLTPEQIRTVIRADTEGALAKLRRLQGYINGMNGKTVKVNIVGGTPGGQLVNANGSITDYYADGGFAENHVAQIAPAGVTRVWNEPETDGEAYIPFAMSKRKRSQQIAMQTVDRLGGVAYFANGGTWRGDTTTAGPTKPPVQIDVYPSEKQSEEALGRAVADQLLWRMTG